MNPEPQHQAQPDETDKELESLQEYVSPLRSRDGTFEASDFPEQQQLNCLEEELEDLVRSEAVDGWRLLKSWSDPDRSGWIQALFVRGERQRRYRREAPWPAPLSEATLDGMPVVHAPPLRKKRPKETHRERKAKERRKRREDRKRRKKRKGGGGPAPKKRKKTGQPAEYKPPSLRSQVNFRSFLKNSLYERKESIALIPVALLIFAIADPIFRLASSFLVWAVQSQVGIAVLIAVAVAIWIKSEQDFR